MWTQEGCVLSRAVCQGVSTLTPLVDILLTCVGWGVVGLPPTPQASLEWGVWSLWPSPHPPFKWIDMYVCSCNGGDMYPFSCNEYVVVS